MDKISVSKATGEICVYSDTGAHLVGLESREQIDDPIVAERDIDVEKLAPKAARAQWKEAYDNACDAEKWELEAGYALDNISVLASWAEQFDVGDRVCMDEEGAFAKA